MCLEGKDRLIASYIATIKSKQTRIVKKLKVSRDQPFVLLQKSTLN